MKILYFVVFFGFFLSGYCQIVNIPDPMFKGALLDHSPSIDTNNDGQIQMSEAAALTGLMLVAERGITDITGIEAFINITKLDVSENLLTEMDLSGNMLLTQVYAQNNLLESYHISNISGLTIFNCSGNQLEEVNVEANTQLQRLYASGNLLHNIDLSNNPNLTILEINDNFFTAIDLNNNPNIFLLSAGNNAFSEIDLSILPNLLILDVGENLLTELDFSNNHLLQNIYAENNQLTSIHVSHLTQLERIRVYDNQIETADVSNNPELVSVNFSNNQLTQLNIANGNNQNMTHFLSLNNPNLFCIQADSDTTLDPPSGWYYDPWSSFEVDCNYVGIEENELDKFVIYPNPVKNRIYFENNPGFVEVIIYDTTGSVVTTQFIYSGDTNIPVNLPTGIYYALFWNDELSVTKKIVVE